MLCDFASVIAGGAEPQPPLLAEEELRHPFEHSAYLDVTGGALPAVGPDVNAVAARQELPPQRCVAISQNIGREYPGSRCRLT